MTALKQYERLEAPGLWRASSDAQRKNVVVSLGHATLTISDTADRALAHWSLPAIHRINPDERPALFSPSPDATETLELEDAAIIDALETLHAVIQKRRPKVGWVRQVLTIGVLAIVALAAIFWVPNALISYTVSVVPQATRDALGERLAARIHRVSGRSCRETLGNRALTNLGRNLLGANPARLIVLAKASRPAMHLPGSIILVNHALIEAYDGPYIVAGFILAEDQRARQTDPMLALLNNAGFFHAVKLLTTGDLSDAVLDRYSEALLTGDVTALPDADLLARFAEAEIPTSPYAFAVDPTGETTLTLIEGDRVPLNEANPLLSDGDWIGLQGICVS